MQKPFFLQLAALITLASLALPAFAQHAGDRDGDESLPVTGQLEAPDVSTFSTTLPNPMPAIPAFETMQRFELDSDTRFQFAIDRPSILLGKRAVMAILAAKSPQGAINYGYYGFDCAEFTYRLLAFQGMKRQWVASSSRVKWKHVHDAESRNRQYRAVFKSACALGGRPVPSVEKLVELLTSGFYSEK